MSIVILHTGLAMWSYLYTFYIIYILYTYQNKTTQIPTSLLHECNVLYCEVYRIYSTIGLRLQVDRFSLGRKKFPRSTSRIEIETIKSKRTRLTFFEKNLIIFNKSVSSLIISVNMWIQKANFHSLSLVYEIKDQCMKSK